MRSQQRRRGVQPTEQGLLKLQNAVDEWVETQKFNQRSSIAALSEYTDLDPETVSKVLHRSAGVDRRTLAKFFNAFNLQLEPSDYTGWINHQTISHIRWQERPDVSVFYGRERELDTLNQWIIKDRCRLIALLGMGGIGKTSLAVKLAEQIQDRFEYVYWRSLRNAPAIDEVIAELIQFLANQQETHLPASLDDSVSRLLHYLCEHRCMVVLDNLESVLQLGTHVGSYRSGCEGYGFLIRSVSEVQHQSCIILTSREQPQGLVSREGVAFPVRSLKLQGLTWSEGQQIISAHSGIADRCQEWEAIFKYYAGNPLALKIVASGVRDVFGGDITESIDYMQRHILRFEDINDLLEQHFERMSATEQQILYWLAVNREPISLAELEADAIGEKITQQLLGALQSLARRCLVEWSDKQLSLQPVVMEYVTQQLIDKVCDQIVNQQQFFLRHFALVKAESKDYIRQAQIRFILRPILDKLFNRLGSCDRIENQLRCILTELRTAVPSQPGYAAGNILNLLREMNADFSHLDCSELTVWQAYLADVNLHHVNFTNADLSKSVFTRVLSAPLAVAYSPDGKYLAIANSDNKVHLWQTTDDRELLTFAGHTSWVWAIAFSPDCQTLASASVDRTIKLWDLTTGLCLNTLQGHTGWVWSVAFSPNGQTLVSSSNDRTVRIWDIHGECLKVFSGHTSRVWSTALSPDGQTLASGGDDYSLKLWDMHTGQIRQILSDRTNLLTNFAFSPNGKILASCSQDCTVKLWDVATGQCLHTLMGHGNNVISIAFSLDCQFLASSSLDCTAKIWDVKTGKCLKTLKGHTNGVVSVAFHPHKQTLATGSSDSTVKLWDISTGQMLKTLQGYSAGVMGISIHPDGQILAIGGNDKLIRLWDMQTAQCLQTFHGHGGWVWSVAFNQDGTTLASGSYDNTVKLWDTQTGELRQSLHAHTSTTLSVTFSPDNRTLASASADHTVRIWDAQTGKCLRTLPHKGRVWAIAFSADGQLLASGCDDGTMRLWDVQSGKCFKELRGHTGLLLSIALSPNQQYAASASDDRTVRLWDIQSGECIKVCQGHTGSVLSIAFSPDSQYIASASDDRTVRLWDIQSGECRRVLQAHADIVMAVAFTPDGQVLASGSQDETVQLWNWRTGECLKTLRTLRPYEGMNITGVKGLTIAELSSLQALGAVNLGKARNS
jgi:WD40 repeat protein